MNSMKNTPVGTASIPSTSLWSKCFDANSGHSYYWNTLSNEVTWEEPKNFVAFESSSLNVKTNEPSTSTILPSTTNTLNVYHKSSLPLVDSQFIDQRKRTINCIRGLCPPDWDKDYLKPKKYGTTEFYWNESTNTTSPLVREPVSNSMTLIAGVYGDDSSDQSDSEEPQSVSKRKMKFDVRPPPAKTTRPLLQPVPHAFHPSLYHNSDDEEEQEQNSGVGENAVEEITNNNPIVEYSPEQSVSEMEKFNVLDDATANVTSPIKTDVTVSPELQGDDITIDAMATELCDKLEALKVNEIDITPLKLLAVQIQTLYVAWQCKALSSSYLAKRLEDMNNEIENIENNNLAPPGWRAQWHRAFKLYEYENLVTGEKQFQVPTLADAFGQDDDEDDVNSQKVSNNDDDDDEIQFIEHQRHRSYSKTLRRGPRTFEPLSSSDTDGSSPPPLPPLTSVSSSPPPLPPCSQVEDMDLDEIDGGSESNHSNLSSIANQQETEFLNTRNQDNSQLTEALDSFYSDLAQIEPSICPAQEIEQKHSAETISYENSREETVRKQKKKLKGSSSLKRKAINQLVVKWQSIHREEANRNS